MRTIDFSQVLFNALQFSGNDRHNIMPETFSQFRDFCSTRMREAWESFEWPDICRVAPFTSSSVSAATALGSSDAVGVYYANQTGLGTRTADSPVAALAYSSPMPQGVHRVQLLIQNRGTTSVELSLATTGATITIYADQSIALNNYNGGFTVSNYGSVVVLEAFRTESSTAMETVKFFTPDSSADEILAVFDRNPLASTRCKQAQYIIYNDGAKRIVTNLDAGWYVYRQRCPELIGDLWESSLAYSKGSQVYFDEGSGTSTYAPVPGKPHKGNFFECLNPTVPGQSPATAPHLWSKIQIPYVFGSYMSWGSTANWQISEGMVAEAGAIESKAKEAIEFEYDKATRQQGQFNRQNMITTY